MRWYKPALAAGSLALTACSAEENGVESNAWHAAMIAEIEQANRDLEAAFVHGDLLGVAGFYADDACLIEFEDEERICGRAAIDEYWARVEEPRDWVLEIEQIGGGPREAYQIGRSTLIYGPAESPDTSVVDFVLIWKRQTDGRWRITHDMY